MRKVRKKSVSFPNRFPRIKKELAASDADIVFLQEVDHQDLYLPFLVEKLGLEVAHVLR